MIQEFVKIWDKHRDKLRQKWSLKAPEDYEDLVQDVMTLIGTNTGVTGPDPNRLHIIDDGHYQGTLLFVIPAKIYQPDSYWYVKVDYGSCSGCDTLDNIREFAGFHNSGDVRPVVEQQLDDYMMLALHVVQNLKKME